MVAYTANVFQLFVLNSTGIPLGSMFGATVDFPLTLQALVIYTVSVLDF